MHQEHNQLLQLKHSQVKQIQVRITILGVNVHIMYMTKLVAQLVILGEMQITGLTQQRNGYTVNNTPKAGAVMQTTQGGYGHVAYVESVNSDGSVTVSEMNYQGVGVVSTRTISASQASSYNYIS